MVSLFGTPCVGFITFLLIIGASRTTLAQDSFLETLSSVATKQARKELRDEKVEFEQSGFKGSVEAIDPKKHFKAEIKKFDLANDVLTTTIKLGGRFRLTGRIEADGSSTEVSSELDLEFTISSDVEFVQEGDKFFIVPDVKDLDIKADIKSLSPSNISGGKSTISAIANSAFARNKKKMIEKANKALGRYEF